MVQVFDFRLVENPVHVHDLHATILHQMGLDHEKLTYRCCPEELRCSFTDRPNPMHPVPHTCVYRICRLFTIHQRKQRQEGETEVSFFAVNPHAAAQSTNCLNVLRNFPLDAEESPVDTIWT